MVVYNSWNWLNYHKSIESGLYNNIGAHLSKHIIVLLHKCGIDEILSRRLAKLGVVDQ